MDSMKEALENAGVLKTKAKQVSPAPNDVRIPTIRSIKETTAVAEKRQYITDIPNHMTGLVFRIRGIRGASAEERAIRSKELKALEDEVLTHLNSEEELLANAARRAHDLAMDSTLLLLANVSVAEMLTRKPGRVFMNVSDTRDGERFLPGGRLLMESNGKAVKVVEAYGNFQRIMTEIAKARVFIPIESLSHERLELAKRLPEDAFRRARILHTVLRRGIAEAQKAK
ncbi:MAG: hypothetical protein ABIH78_03005 [Candidatus Peregrinibacteria bacterium]